ncbi:GNAT family N-acetyltransferase [Lipingzhangella sp. LS1_29]|uniref:GNAT family N-acetyltransferase n=1 Tax=Lipingzhangella rawalii TaxID=2055835 RepID=A0ABU2H1B2_9ACTN|nr:GNAT family N-acetyltransferase [Lipingzhangella rawalii]MDS1269091.1 GNAT family N-acetyltransferase [Lipingzhangella rawalii]
MVDTRKSRPGAGDGAYRLAGAADAAALVTLVNSAYRGETSRRGWTTEADLLGGQRVDCDSIVELLQRPDTVLLLAEQAGALRSCCELRQLSDDTAYFGMFCVSPGMQGHGLGRQMLAEAERRVVQKWGCTRMVMTVLRQRDDLISWYERRGYRRTGRRQPFPYGDTRLGIPKRGDLEFEELARELPSR